MVAGSFLSKRTYGYVVKQLIALKSYVLVIVIQADRVKLVLLGICLKIFFQKLVGKERGFSSVCELLLFLVV